jgi:acyl-CoA thioester hydrolase
VDRPRLSVKHRVLYAECDPFGVVYNVNYLVFFEHARVELMRAQGLSYRELKERGYEMPIIETGARFKKPADYDDLITITAICARQTRTRLFIEYEVTRESKLLATGFTNHVLVTREGELRRFPDWLAEVFERRPQT